MSTIIPREQANLPPVPSSIGHRTLSSWAGIRIHHTGGAFSSWRAVHDWQTTGRPPGERLAYIGYSFGLAGGRVTELRGWDHHPAHDNINTHLGVVFGGSFGTRLPTTADLDALIWFIDEAERRTGKRMPVSTHREVAQTACPGDRLHTWVKQSLPDRLKEDDMPLTKADVDMIFNTDNIIRAPVSAASHETNTHWTAASYLASIRNWAVWAAERAAANEARLAAVLAAVNGQDPTEAFRAELDRHRGLMLDALTETLPDALAERLADVPAEKVRTAVREELSALRLVAEPA